MARFVVAGPSEYLAITGWGIDDVKLAKKAWVFAGQKCSRFDISPVNYEFNVEAMSSEKLAFNLPAVFTIGPKITPAPALEVDGASNQRRVLMPESEEAVYVMKHDYFDALLLLLINLDVKFVLKINNLIVFCFA
jgi:hypothetical protein